MLGKKLWPYYLYIQKGECLQTFLCMSREGAMAIFSEMKRWAPDCVGYLLRVTEKEASILSFEA